MKPILLPCLIPGLEEACQRPRRCHAWCSACQVAPLRPGCMFWLYVLDSMHLNLFQSLPRRSSPQDCSKKNLINLRRQCLLEMPSRPLPCTLHSATGAPAHHPSCPGAHLGAAPCLCHLAALQAFQCALPGVHLSAAVGRPGCTAGPGPGRSLIPARMQGKVNSATCLQL